MKDALILSAVVYPSGPVDVRIDAGYRVHGLVFLIIVYEMSVTHNEYIALMRGAVDQVIIARDHVFNVRAFDQVICRHMDQLEVRSEHGHASCCAYINIAGSIALDVVYL